MGTLQSLFNKSNKTNITSGEYLRSEGVEEYQVFETRTDTPQVISIDEGKGNFSYKKLLLSKSGENAKLSLLFENDSVKLLAENGVINSSSNTDYPILSIDTFELSSKVVVADINHDGLDDIVIEKVSKNSKTSLDIYINKGPVANTDKAVNDFIEYFESQNVRPVPEYKRTGTIKIGAGYFDASTIEEIEPLDKSKLKGKLKYDQKIPPNRLPKKFQLGVFKDAKDGNNPREKDIKQWLSNIGLPYDGTIEHWTQDRNEYALNDSGAVIDVMSFFGDNTTGGNISHVENSNGEMYVTVTDRELKKIQEKVLEKSQTLICILDAKKIYAKMMGVEQDHIIVMPKIANFIHIDQYVTFPKDGKVIILKLPKDHPDYASLQNVKKDLEVKSFHIVDEIEVPTYFLKNARSPFNMLMHKDAATGNVRYVIPLEPVAILENARSMFIDLKMGELSISRDDDRPDYVTNDFTEVDLLSRGYGAHNNIYTIYDTQNPWDCVVEMKNALISTGVPEKDIFIVPHNGLGGGSLHCISNVYPTQEKLIKK